MTVLAARIAALYVSIGIATHGLAGTAFILDPPPGFKLAEAQRRKVRIGVAIGDPAAAWRLSVTLLSTSEETTLASGVGDVDAVVGEVSASELQKGEPYELRLHTVLGVHTVPFAVPDQQYVLIPLDPGDFEHNRVAGRSVDRTGFVVMYGGRNPSVINVLQRDTGSIVQPEVNEAASAGQILSGDGRRFYYDGLFSFPNGIKKGLGYLDLATRENIGLVPDAHFRFSVSHDGARMVFQHRLSRDLPYQYYLHEGGEVTQLTDSPDAVVSGGPLDCPRTLGSKPLITADGRRVILITRSTLGLPGAPEGAGCKIIFYDVETGKMGLLHSLPEGNAVGPATLSDDGRWLSHTVSRLIEGNVRIAHGAVLDLETGERIDPIADVYHEPTFDAAITGDGRKIVISTTADLDPRVGNGDRNMELFLYDRESGGAIQVTDTIGGIVSRPGGCSTFRPAVDRHGDVILSGFMVINSQGCQLDGPQFTSTSLLNLHGYRAVRKRVGNRGTALNPLEPEVYAEAGRVVELPFSATDPDGDPISLFIQLVGDIRIPDGARVVDRRDGTGLMTWPTRPEQRGIHRFRVAAFDEGGGETFEDVTVTVSHSADCDANGRVDTAEVRRCVTSALGASVPPDCRLCDADGDGTVTIDELVRGVVASGPVG